jgi:Tol biopolymer transport system component/predicted Ser/Thr protein kinase
MALSAGTRLGPYEILAPIGAGGMGEVYRAKDTKLDREVAIKVLPATLAQDPERLARFEREAKVLAALNHPNVAQIYGVEDRALVMELVPGESLKGPLPLETALNYAKQIADALEAAHDKGIIHRDLKPANIMITPLGVVKVLDFGLAAVTQSSDPSNPVNSPTLTISPTRAGMILGTAAYMSPEQARGKPADKRADIWAFGVVFFELLTGHRLFEGETVSDTLAAVLTKEPEWAQIPAKVRRLLKKCLEKDPKRRLRDIGDAWELLEEPGETVPASAKTSSRVGALAWSVALVALALAGWGWYRATRPAEEPRVLKMSVLPPEKSALRGDIPAVSPDGQRVAFAAVLDGKTSLWVRDLGSLEARALPGTQGASLPFWSPDSHFLGFFANGKLRKTEVAGGPVQTLCDAPVGRGGTWNRTDVIVFAPELLSGLFRVSAAGGTPVPVTALNAQEPAHRYPWFLPDGRHFLYTAYGQSGEKFTVYVADLESKTRSALIPATSNVVYAWPGYLLFLRELTLMAQPFDAAKLQTTGDAVPVAEHIGYTAVDVRASFSASQNGVLVYHSSGALSTSINSQLTWFDRFGKMTGKIGATGGLVGAALSANGNSVATTRLDPQAGVFDIWLYDLARGTNSRFTSGSPYNAFPVWSPDSTHIAFFDGAFVNQRTTNGAGQDEILDKSTRFKIPVDWSKDGRYIIEEAVADSKTGSDIWVLPLFGDKKPFPYLQTDANEAAAKLSPNGQWLAYQSDESKRNEIYVTTFPQPGGKWQISTDGGSYPVWSRDGKELFYISADGKMMAVDVKSGPKFDPGVPRSLFDVGTDFTAYGDGYDVGNDGRFLIPVSVEQSGAHPITVVLNWQAGLKK